MENSGSILPAEILNAILDAVAPGQEIYLVGGSVRDILLGRPAHDYDFVLSGDPRGAARRVANRLKGGFFTLDDERNTCRVLLHVGETGGLLLDFVGFRGNDLQADLLGRDFTINAIAIDLRSPGRLYDPLGGAKDLRAKLLRACAPDAMVSDPLRVLRGVRLAGSLNLHIEPVTRGQMREAGPLLKRVSAERKRDELFRILEGPRPASVIRALDVLDCLPEVLPELAQLRGVPQTPPHTHDVWNHTLAVLEQLHTLVAVLASGDDPNVHGNLYMGMASLRLGRFRPMFQAHLGKALNPNRSLVGLLYLGALYHDVSKPTTFSVGKNGRIHNYGHEDEGAQVVYTRGQALQLSNVESERLRTLIQNHMRIHHLVRSGKAPSRRAVYRFFRDCGEVGVEVCLHTLADTLGTYGTTLPPEKWQAYLDVCRELLENWWEHPGDSVRPAQWINGHDVQQIFGLPPGPAIGELLESLRESQAMGNVTSREQALVYARNWLQNKKLIDRDGSSTGDADGDSST